jgi:hypothetical protein
VRRALATLTALLLLALAPVALGASQNYKDKFDTGGYSGNDGSLKWSGPWKEVGENDGPESGAVRVEGSGCSGKCLTIYTGLLEVAAGAYRLADTEDFADAELSYWVAFETGLLGLATLTVEATSNGGGSWTTIQTIDSVLGGGSKSVDVTGFRGKEFGVRFTATGALDAKVLIDDVKVSGEVPPPSTTTTTTTTTTSSTTTTSTTTTTTTLLTLPPLLDTTTTTSSTTTTTSPIATTTTSEPTSTTTTSDSTTTTEESDATTPLAAPGGEDGGGDAGGTGGDVGSGGEDESPSSGLRQTSVGIESDFETGLFGSPPEVLGFEINAGFTNAVEVVEASWYWVLGLALLIAAALIKGIDSRIGKAERPE